MPNIHQLLLDCTLAELHTAIKSGYLGIWPVDHADLEKACMARIAAIPRLPLSRDGRWWHYPNSTAYPWGN